MTDCFTCNRSRKYYFVQISNGESTWDTPTSAAPQVPTPGATPAQEMNPYGKPNEGEGGVVKKDDGSATYAPDGQGQEGERSLGVSDPLSWHSSISRLIYRRRGV